MTIYADDTVPVSIPEAPQRSTKPLLLTTPNHTHSTAQAVSTSAERRTIDILMCRESIASMRWWLFVAVLLSIVLQAGSFLIAIFH